MFSTHFDKEEVICSGGYWRILDKWQKDRQALPSLEGQGSKRGLFGQAPVRQDLLFSKDKGKAVILQGQNLSPPVFYLVFLPEKRFQGLLQASVLSKAVTELVLYDL